MNISTFLVRTLFIILSVVLVYACLVGNGALNPGNLLWGAIIGVGAGSLLIFLSHLLKRFNLRSFNITLLGLLLGYFMASAINGIFNAILVTASLNLNGEVISLIKIFLLFFGLFSGIVITRRSADELYLSIPFIRFSPTLARSKAILVDASALTDPRIIDLASSGLLDHSLVMPKFYLKELHEEVDAEDEILKNRARRSLEVLKKLEEMPSLHLRFNAIDFPEIKELSEKVLRLAHLLEADVLISDANSSSQSSMGGVRTINLHLLAGGSKSLVQRGENLKIKIQRYGKEELQGVGYLEDGTMVVVNGGGSYIGETIRTRVLSVKHTTSGRMIFCNAESAQNGFDEEDFF